MPATKDRPIAQRLTWMNMLVCAVALLLACAAFIGYDLVTFRSARVSNLSTQAQIVSANCVTAIVFDDPESATKTLSALKADPQILSAVIYTADGKPFATYSRPGSSPVPVPPSIPSGQLEGHWIKDGEVLLARSIVFDGKANGVVFLRSDVEALRQRLKLYAGIASLVLLISLLAALGVSAIFRRSVAEPIVLLAEAAREVSSSKAYSLRVVPFHGHGEISVLIESFNQMMEQIEKSEASLQKAHDEHEQRTPLNAVLGFSELLTDTRYGPLTERQARYVKHIHTSGQHLLRLINDILDLSKIEAGRLQLSIECVSVETTIADVCESLDPLVAKNAHQLVRDIPSGLVVHADATRFRQMLMNLLGNAIKFTPKGGKIELAARQVGGMVRMEVRDSGPGIPTEERQRIFEAFHRLKQSEKASEGTGLGLAITRRLVELHGGVLNVESEPGEGSCFFFTLPSACASQPEQNDLVVATDGLKAPVRVLIIEDDSSSAYLLESQLSSAGYEVSICSRPDQAFDKAIEWRPTVITLDVVMLPINGWEVLSKLKSDPRTADIGVVMVTVMDQKKTGTLLGADEYIMKPVDKSLLLAAIERCLNRRNSTTESQSILVVEDNAATRELIVDLLTRSGYVVSSAEDGLRARAKVQSALPDLVILDLMLPGISGFDLIAEWRKDARTAHLPIFVLTNGDLTIQEKNYLSENTGALVLKDERWRDELIRQVQRAQGTVPRFAEA